MESRGGVNPDPVMSVCGVGGGSDHVRYVIILTGMLTADVH